MENPAFVLELDEKSGNVKNGTKTKSADVEKIYSFEEAVVLIGTGKFHYFLFMVCGLCFMTVMVETMGISISMPIISCDLESTIGEQGILASAGFLGIVLSSHAMGFLADTWGRVKTLRTAVILGFITTVISAFSVNIWMLIVFRILNGLVISGCQACVFSFLGEFHGRKTRVKHVTLLSMFMPLGLVFLPSMAIWILPIELNAIVFGIPFEPWRILLLANSILSILALSGLFLIPESPKFVLIQGKNEEALRTFRKIFRINTGKPESEYPVKKVCMEIAGANLSDIGGVKDACKLIWSQTAPLFNKERVLHTLNICFIMFVIFAVAQGTFMWFPTILDRLVAYSGEDYTMCEILTMSSVVANNTVAGNVTAAAGQCSGSVNTFMFTVLIIIGAVFTVIYMGFGLIIDLVGKRILLVLWLTLCVACSLAIHWVRSFILSVIMLTLVIAIGNCGGIVSTISIEYFPTNVNAMGMCLIMMLGRLGAVAGSNFVGLVIFNSCDTLFYVYMGLIGVIGALSYLLPDKKKSKPEILKPTTEVYSIRPDSIRQISET